MYIFDYLEAAPRVEAVLAAERRYEEEKRFQRQQERTDMKQNMHFHMEMSGVLFFGRLHIQSRRENAKCAG